MQILTKRQIYEHFKMFFYSNIFDQKSRIGARTSSSTRAPVPVVLCTNRALALCGSYFRELAKATFQELPGAHTNAMK